MIFSSNFVKSFITIGLALLGSFAIIALSVSAATTISTNIDTAGTLSVTGNSTITSADIGGGYTAGSGTGATISSAGALSINGDLNVNGNATTTASSGNIETAGTLTVVGNSIQTSSDFGGGYTAGSGSGATITSAGLFSINSDFRVNGFATTTASSGNFATEGSVTIGGSTGTAIVRHISSSASLNFPIVAGSSCDTQTLTVTGAADGDTVSLGVPNALATASTTLVFQGWVSSSNTVSVRLCQVATTGISDPAAATVRADVWKH